MSEARAPPGMPVDSTLNSVLIVGGTTIEERVFHLVQSHVQVSEVERKGWGFARFQSR